MTPDLASPESFNAWLTLAPGFVLTAFLLTSWRRAIAIPFLLSFACHGGVIWAVREQGHDRSRPAAIEKQVLPDVNPKNARLFLIASPKNAPAAEVSDIPRATPDFGVPVEASIKGTLPAVLNSLPVKVGSVAGRLELPRPSRERPEIDQLQLRSVEEMESVLRKLLAARGGEEGVLTFTLFWLSNDDLDLQVVGPDGNRVAWYTTGSGPHKLLDVDANRGLKSLTDRPIENIRWLAKDTPLAGTYTVYVDHYADRSKESVNFWLRVLVDGKLVDMKPDEISFKDRDYQHPEKAIYKLEYVPAKR